MQTAKSSWRSAFEHPGNDAGHRIHWQGALCESVRLCAQRQGLVCASLAALKNEAEK
jgi:hypothetical protein